MWLACTVALFQKAIFALCICHMEKLELVSTGAQGYLPFFAPGLLDAAGSCSARLVRLCSPPLCVFSCWAPPACPPHLSPPMYETVQPSAASSSPLPSAPPHCCCSSQASARLSKGKSLASCVGDQLRRQLPPVAAACACGRPSVAQHSTWDDDRLLFLSLLSCSLRQVPVVHAFEWPNAALVPEPCTAKCGGHV